MGRASVGRGTGHPRREPGAASSPSTPLVMGRARALHRRPQGAAHFTHRCKLDEAAKRVPSRHADHREGRVRVLKADAPGSAGPSSIRRFPITRGAVLTFVISATSIAAAGPGAPALRAFEIGYSCGARCRRPPRPPRDVRISSPRCGMVEAARCSCRSSSPGITSGRWGVAGADLGCGLEGTSRGLALLRILRHYDRRGDGGFPLRVERHGARGDRPRSSRRPAWRASPAPRLRARACCSWWCSCRARASALLRIRARAPAGAPPDAAASLVADLLAHCRDAGGRSAWRCQCRGAWPSRWARSRMPWPRRSGGRGTRAVWWSRTTRSAMMDRWIQPDGPESRSAYGHGDVRQVRVRARSSPARLARGHAECATSRPGVEAADPREVVRDLNAYLLWRMGWARAPVHAHGRGGVGAPSPMGSTRAGRSARRGRRAGGSLSGIARGRGPAPRHVGVHSGPCSRAASAARRGRRREPRLAQVGGEILAPRAPGSHPPASCESR